MEQIIFNPMFGITLCIIGYSIAQYICGKLKTPLANVLVIATLIVIGILLIFNIPLEAFEVGGDMIAMFLGPVTTILAVSIYKQKTILKKYLFPIIAGCFAGAFTSMASVYGLFKIFGIDETLMLSFIPKSVTTPIAIELSMQNGGIAAITVAAVAITGISGAVLAPSLIKIMKIKNPIAIGIAMGTSSHAIGTSRAVEMGEIQGATSGVAIGITGILTIVLSIILRG